MGYSPWGCKESDMTEHARTHTQWFLGSSRIHLTPPRCSPLSLIFPHCPRAFVHAVPQLCPLPLAFLIPLVLQSPT